MDSLRELISLITQKRIKKVELFDESNRNKTSNYFRLFEGIHSRKYDNDLDAAKDIYDCLPSEKKYLILKTRLRQKLLNTLFFLDYDGEKSSEFQRISYDCNKQLYAIKVLLMANAKRLAVPMAEKTLRLAADYELTDIVLECARILREHYSGNNYQEFLEYKDIAERTEQQQRIENMAEQYYQEIIALYAKSKGNRLRVRKMADKYYHALEENLRPYDSIRLRLYYYKIKMLFYQLSDDYKAAIDVVNAFEEFISQTPAFHPTSRLEELAIQKMNYYLHLKDFSAGEAHAQKFAYLFADKNPNQYTFKEYQLLLAMHTEHYLRAAEIFHEVISQSTFRTLSEAKKERWSTFQAYLHYIYKYQKIKEIRPLIQNSKTGFQLSDFLEKKPEFAKERRGLNGAILTIQVLFFLEKMNIDSLIDRINEIERYTRRYPKKDMNFRSECFINLLTQMRDDGFRFYQTRKATEKLYDEMKSVMMEYYGGNRALEVLPYEVMWDMVLEKLKGYKYG
ncbi:hypothetical protein QNI19_15405 [Cytophagaceae bacterium DM2B3-1]|uniref:Uncharacterized protein n=2 Tax=Xanthocytophaga TaxID=3078918 RepID=A0AAE3QU12_9BACT|nr:MULTISPECIES: hypothetical protein [Xanthocytophaga]MDJ1469816.1 hypothetical protein [Xanthocytophaga flavus]MDJ1483220.1 hypothetical protein [Xanthocytophaga flavus]MDJ1494329.1 hypothetical protein [Xanthocytophaga flavus]MDJ1503259.1 hypothetical protein [Xanthocytophaga agilis]